MEASDTGWSEKKKWLEFTEKNARYLAVFCSGTKELVGYLYFQFIMEDTANDSVQIPVIYCFELQIKNSYKRQGIGAFLMSMFEGIGKKQGMVKAMLTVFKNNTSAISFYQIRNYLPDEISPSCYYDSQEEASQFSYEIFSKSLLV